MPLCQKLFPARLGLTQVPAVWWTCFILVRLYLVLKIIFWVMCVVVGVAVVLLSLAVMVLSLGRILLPRS
jgi:hypothetical protein